MSLKEKINADLKTAMKSGDKIRLETIRSIRALILEFEKNGSGKDLDNETEIKMLSTAAKKRQEAADQFRKGERIELAEKEEAELKIIQEYLPKQLSKMELESTIRALAAELDVKDKSGFPKLMPEAAKRLKGQADGKSIREMVEHILS